MARWAGVPAATWAGGATVALALFVIVEIVMHRSTYGEFTAQSVATLASVLLAGPAVYLVARYVRRRRRGIDPKLAMIELPPE